MNISICITVLNEEKSIGKLLDSLLSQSKKADEIIVVDGGSSDRTAEIIRHFQKKDGRIKFLIEKCTRAKGRNIACDMAKNEIIAITDADCVADRDWLKNITAPFIHKEVEISAGFYRMVANSSFGKAASLFFGVLPSNFDVNFLPSARSIAFRKKVWEEIGGFPRENENFAEDTYFNFYALKLGVKYARVKNAIVEWSIPEDLSGFFNKIRNYARWDAKSKVWFFPKKGLSSHNIKALFVIFRYLFGVFLLAVSIKNIFLLPVFLILSLFYLIWSYRKVYLAFRDVKVAIYGPILQIAADLGVIIGFMAGFWPRKS